MQTRLKTLSASKTTRSFEIINKYPSCSLSASLQDGCQIELFQFQDRCLAGAQYLMLKIDGWICTRGTHADGGPTLNLL